MNVLNFKMTEQIKENLEYLLKNKKRKTEIEENIKIELLRTRQDLNPNDYTLEISYNKMSKNFDIILKRLD